MRQRFYVCLAAAVMSVASVQSFAAVSAIAQEITVLITAPRAQRQGVEVTPSITVPQTATGQIELVGDIRPQDYVDPSKSLKLRVYMMDGGIWREILSFGWQGIAGGYIGPDGEVNPMPSVALRPAEAFRGRELRLEIEVPVRMSVGGVMQLSPIPE